MVANLPFAAGTAILRRLLDDPRVALRRVDAIVERGLGAKRTRIALRDVAFANDANARDLDARQWAALYRVLH